MRRALLLSLATAVLVFSQTPARQIDHIDITSPKPEKLFRYLSETLKLPGAGSDRGNFSRAYRVGIPEPRL